MTANTQLVLAPTSGQDEFRESAAFAIRYIADAIAYPLTCEKDLQHAQAYLDRAVKAWHAKQEEKAA